jgi:hypothetical protein
MFLHIWGKWRRGEGKDRNESPEMLTNINNDKLKISQKDK